MDDTDYIVGLKALDHSPFYLSDDARARHIYVPGQTGVGKSELLYNFIRYDFASARGLIFLDPHGDNALRAVSSVPKHRILDTIYFDPLADYTVCYNPIVEIPSDHRYGYAADIATSFSHIWPDSWGTRMERILTQSILLLLHNTHRQHSLADIPRLLVDTHYQRELLRTCKDQHVIDYWTLELPALIKKFGAEALQPVQNKIGQFADNPILRRAIDGKSTIDIAGIMDSGKILVCNFSKLMGDEPSRILGSLLVTRISQAAQARANKPENERQPVTLLIDEFQNFASKSFATILSEARKYKLNLVLAHQYLEQVPSALQHAVFGNAGTTICFRIGAFDAPIFAKHLNQEERELLDLPNFTARVKTINDGRPSDAFRIEMVLLPSVVDSLQRVRDNTRNRYAKQG